MRGSIFDHIGNLDTLIAVIVGALLATGGALVADIIQDRRMRTRREREAARFFGDLLMTFDQVLEFTLRSQTIGDPWGPLTTRLFSTAMREAKVYERNRERLFELEDIKLRSRIHTHFLVETFPLEAIIEFSQEISEIEDALDSDVKWTKSEIAAMNSDLAKLQERRESSLAALKREKLKTDAICADLEKIAKIKFDITIDQDSVAVPVDIDQPSQG